MRSRNGYGGSPRRSRRETEKRRKRGTRERESERKRRGFVSATRKRRDHLYSVQIFRICNLYQTGRKSIPKQGWSWLRQENSMQAVCGFRSSSCSSVVAAPAAPRLPPQVSIPLTLNWNPCPISSLSPLAFINTHTHTHTHTCVKIDSRKTFASCFSSSNAFHNTQELANRGMRGIGFAWPTLLNFVLEFWFPQSDGFYVFLESKSCCFLLHSKLVCLALRWWCRSLRFHGWHWWKEGQEL